MYFWDKHKTITTYYELLSGEVCDRYGLTQMEYDILMFLHNNPQYNTAAEIVKIRKSTKSHVSTSLKNLESKGLVERIQSKDNKKHIEIALLDQAEIIIEAGLNTQKEFAHNVLRGLTEEETRLCIRVFDKICNNAEEQLKNYKENAAVKHAPAPFANAQPEVLVSSFWIICMYSTLLAVSKFLSAIVAFSPAANVGTLIASTITIAIITDKILFTLLI